MLTCGVIFMPVSQIHGNGRSTRTTCLVIVTKAGTTTTTTPRRICFLRGTPATRLHVTAYDLAGEMCWILLKCSTGMRKTFKKRKLPVFSYTDGSSTMHMVLSAQTMVPHLPLLLFLDTTITYPKSQNRTHLCIPDPPCPPVKLQAQPWSRSQHPGLVWRGSTKDSGEVYQEQTPQPSRMSP